MIPEARGNQWMGLWDGCAILRSVFARASFKGRLMSYEAAEGRALNKKKKNLSVFSGLRDGMSSITASSRYTHRPEMSSVVASTPVRT